ncbi:MAG TPA: hypothetical protein VNO14_13165 [Blastocatellia bacterium]|nr:hypothetical protein [Blastocatellia bacterium]
MLSNRRGALAAAFVILATAIVAFAQVPTRAKMHFTIDVPYELKMGGYLLPPGKYVLFQSSQDPNRFALYSRHLAHEPIAMIQTTRARYWSIPDDRETQVWLEIDETSDESHPVLRGWNLPYADGWEIVSVKVSSDSPLVRVR